MDAGLPEGPLNLVFGIPEQISNILIPAPLIRTITFTCSTSVGQRLGALAAIHMKPATVELGGHASVLVFDDANTGLAACVI